MSDLEYERVATPEGLCVAARARHVSARAIFGGGSHTGDHVFDLRATSRGSTSHCTAQWQTAWRRWRWAPTDRSAPVAAPASVAAISDRVRAMLEQMRDNPVALDGEDEQAAAAALLEEARLVLWAAA